MKVVFVNINMHNKNKNALFKYNNNYFVVDSIDAIANMNLEGFDCVYSPAIPIDVNKYPNTKFIFGPHFSVFPQKNHMNTIRGKNTVYIQPSEWARDVWKYNPFCENIRVETLPFGVDTEKFRDIKSIQDRDRVFIYCKHRDPNDLKLLCEFMQKLQIPYVVFSYNNRYDESQYINYLQNSKYGIWLGGHESQGFALEEALSCNVPLLVWNVKSMNQEYKSTYNDIPATSIPYWDERCGEFFYNATEIETTFARFLSKLSTYKPREYILENLAITKCDEKMSLLISSI